MDKYIKQSIDARKNALSANYSINSSQQKSIDSLFAKIEDLGNKCKDVGDFEAAFAASPLNQQYLDLFTAIATNSQAKASVPQVSKSEIGKTVAGGTAVGIAESAADQAIDAVVPTRAAVHQKASDAVRNVPVLGDVVDAGQKTSYMAHLGNLFKSRKKKK